MYVIFQADFDFDLVDIDLLSVFKALSLKFGPYFQFYQIQRRMNFYLELLPCTTLKFEIHYLILLAHFSFHFGDFDLLTYFLFFTT